MASGHHGGMPSEVFKGIILRANPTDKSLVFEVSRMNNYRNAGLYRDDNFIMGVCLNEFPEYTVRSKDGGIEALGWREALTSLLMEGYIFPNQEVTQWLGADGVAYALRNRGGEWLPNEKPSVVIK